MLLDHYEKPRHQGVLEDADVAIPGGNPGCGDVLKSGLTMDQVLDLDYHEMIEQLGRQVVASRPKCATLGLGTLKAAIRKYQKDRRLERAGVTRPDDGGLIFGENAAAAAKTQ